MKNGISLQNPQALNLDLMNKSTHKFGNLGEIFQGPIPWKIQTTTILSGIDNLNNSIFIKEMELGVKSSLKNKSPDGFSYKFYQIFKEEIKPILNNLFQKIKEEGILPKSFETNITLIPKPDKKTRNRPLIFH